MQLWCTEEQTEYLGLTTRIKETLFTGKSAFQDIAIVDSYQFGRMLVLDGIFQTSIAEEFVYHEMIAHVPLFIHPNPQTVLVIGGGDGGTVREVVRHSRVKSVEMVEIDGMVVDVAKQYLPEISVAIKKKNPKLKVTIGDGIAYVKTVKNMYDVIIVDCSDPIGPGCGLFTHEFYKNVYQALKPDGLFVQQTESPFYHQSLIKKISYDVAAIFPVQAMYLAHIPLYPGGMHCFTMGSKKYGPSHADIKRESNLPMRYYNESIQQACFALPNFLKDIIKS